MGRSKPRTNKRPPPKPQKAQLPPAVLQHQSTNLPYLNGHDGGHQLSDLSFVPPSAPMDPNDPAFTSALQNWSATALGRLDQLPKLTQTQLNALATAAAGMSEATGFLPANGNASFPVDLPASLAALFEAKLTLDREKAKLMRMQKELKGYREGVAAVSQQANGKGKEVILEDDLECTCGRQRPSYPASAHSGEVYEDDEFYDPECDSYNCNCDCHFAQCDHGEDCDCEHDLEPSEDDHHHHHHHDYGEKHTCGHDHDHDHDHVQETEVPSVIPNPYLPQSDNATGMTYAQALDAYQQERDSAARGLNEIGGMFRAAGWDLQQAQQGPRKRLADDPERLDEAVRELFNWIKAVVWTIEQAANLAGKKSWQS